MSDCKEQDVNTSNPENARHPSLVSAWVFAGGEFHNEGFDPDWVATGDIVVGVDHGISHCLDTGLIPDIMLGDFDSVDASVLRDQRLADVSRQAYPSRKNRSDLELALDWLSEAKVARVILMGVSGGRSDHHLINWMLPCREHWPFAIEIIDATVHAHVVTTEHRLDVAAWLGQTISLMPLHEAVGVTTTGLEYALHEAHLVPGTTLGLSNVASEEAIRVSLSSGRLLVFRVIADKMLVQ